MMFLWRLRRIPAALGTLWIALWDRRTPWPARGAALLAAAYLVWPLDVVPDVIPFAGWLDEAIVLPLLLGLARRFVPAPVLAEAEAKRASRPARLWWPWVLLVLLLAAGLWWWWPQGAS